MFQRSPLLRCLALYRHTPVRFVLTVVLFALLNLSLSWQQWLLGRAVDDVTGGAAAGRNDVLWHWVTLILALAALRGVVQYGTNILSHVIGQRLMVSLREMILAQAQRLPLAYHMQHGMGEMVTRTTRDVDKVRDALITFWRQVVDTLFVVLAAVGLLLWYDIWLGVVVLALTALGLGLFIHQSERLVVLDRAVGRAYDRVNQDLSEGISGVRVIKSFGLETQRVEAFGAQVAVFVQHARAALWYASTRIPVPQIVVALGHVWILAYGAWLVAQGRMGLGELTASLLIATTLVFRIEGIGRVMQAFADARASAARIWDMLDTPVQIVSAEGLLPQGALGVRLESVGLTLVEGGSRVLAACSLEVRPGECVALVGATGAGKSSLVALLPRFLDAGEGRVSLGREDAWRDVRECDLPALRRRVHLVTQESFLFADTLRANLLMARPEASEAQLLEALQRAALDDLPALLAQGLDTVLGDRGVTLSGGQRQRMCLARALLAEPDLLVLDDATSALDSVTEKRILDGIRSAPRPPTVLLVASKLSTVLQADRVVMLAAGAIQAEGSHEDLVRSSAAYRELMGLGHGAQ